jgi:very-short-patch-repair endonuclease
MARKTRQSIWQLASEQHGVVTRSQLLDRGVSRNAIEHRLARGRLHRVRQGVYAVGRRQLTRYGRWMAAVLSCGDGAALSHETAAALWGMHPAPATIHVSVCTNKQRQAGIMLHRRSLLDVTRHHNIPVTPPAFTIVDIAPGLTRDELEHAINQADNGGLITPYDLRAAVDAMPPRPGTAVVRDVLDRQTFRLTQSALERRFIPLAINAGLDPPLTQQWVNGFRVDFYWPDLNLVVETDGLRYHRTPAQQAVDRRRDQAHAAAGTERLRFTHGQVAYESAHVTNTLTHVANRLLRARRSVSSPPSSSS